jgi:hypothetical protein
VSKKKIDVEALSTIITDKEWDIFYPMFCELVESDKIAAAQLLLEFVVSFSEKNT